MNEAVVQQIVDTAGSNFHVLMDLASSTDPMEAIERAVMQETSYLRKLLVQHKEAFDVLLKVSKGEKITYNYGESHELLLSALDNRIAFCGLRDNYSFTLSTLVTKKALQIIEQEVLRK